MDEKHKRSPPTRTEMQRDAKATPERLRLWAWANSARIGRRGVGLHVPCRIGSGPRSRPAISGTNVPVPAKNLRAQYITLSGDRGGEWTRCVAGARAARAPVATMM